MCIRANAEPAKEIFSIVWSSANCKVFDTFKYRYAQYLPQMSNCSYRILNICEHPLTLLQLLEVICKKESMLISAALIFMLVIELGIDS